MSTHNHGLVNIQGLASFGSIPAAPASAKSFDFDALRAKLATQSGPRLWKSLEQVAETPEFQEWAAHEFAPGEEEWKDPVSRRRLLQLLGASMGLAGLTACTRQPAEKIVPYVEQPEEVIPGKPLFFATAAVHQGYAKGILVESHTGRPTKIEGNSEHPASLGSTDVFTQAATLNFYDPDRSQAVVHNGRLSSWQNFSAAMALAREEAMLNQGAGFRFLTGNTTSPTFGSLMQRTLAEFSGAKWHQYEAAGRDNVHAGARLAFNRDVGTRYDLTQANVVVALDSDFLAFGPGCVRYSRDFSARRSPDDGGVMNRLYVVESAPTSTGATADHRLPLASSGIDGFARALAAALGVAGITGATSAPAEWVAAVAADLQANRGASVVIVGDHQPPAVHAVAHAINAALGNVGRTVVYIDPVENFTADGTESLRELIDEMNQGSVTHLFILGGNPIYDAPADLDFQAALSKVATKVHLSGYQDETSALCEWHIPLAYELEQWSDALAFDGTATIIQPLIAPLYGGRTALEVLAVLQGRAELTPYQLLREYWSARHAQANVEIPFDDAWRKSVHDGVLANTAFPPINVALRGDMASALPPAMAVPEGTEVNFRPDPCVFDGRYANNGWLQELPKPLTKLTWDNAVLAAPAMAESMGVSNGDIVELRNGDRRVRGPIWILPGHVNKSLTVHLGYGRTRGGNLANQIGFRAGAVRTSDALWTASNIEVTKTGDSFDLASVQDHHTMEGRDIIRVGAAAEYRANPRMFEEAAEAREPAQTADTIYPPEHTYTGNSWGMAIDLNVCTGCNACTIACRAENNIAVVGKDQISRGREMDWIRIDRYFEGDLDNPNILHQPLACHQCDQAPCEGVCPVGATNHSGEGLNQMVYNRCIGTRYCSNNCPYKVRRFNFYLYSDWYSESLKPMRNPNVTVRSRGVMEKCTYCVQRINSVRIETEKEGREIRDGEVVTACQAVCPTRAIYFGNMNDPESEIARIKKSERNYKLLDAELNTAPRTSFLSKLRNLNPALAAASPAGEAGEAEN